MVLLANPGKVLAASANISVSGSPKTVVVGNRVKVTITISSSSALGSWYFDVKYDTAKLKLVSSNLETSTRSAGVVSNGTTKSKTYTLTFTTKSSGTAKVWVANSEVYGYNFNALSSSEGSYSFNIITQQQLEDSYSKNNNLKSLSVDGQELVPKFDKNTLEYSLELENGTESITISASKEDSKAVVTGTGTKTVTEGDNRFVIRVTAENGSVKDYIINAHVKELNPIELTINDEVYTVVRKSAEIPTLSTFIQTTTYIDGEEVPALQSDITGYLLIAVRDSNANMYLYKIEEDGSYTRYEETAFSGITLFIIEPKAEDIPEGYETKTELTLDDKKVTAYSSKDNPYPIVYGVNVETGKENWYSYDEEEGTLQRFENTKVMELTKMNQRLLLLVTLLSASSLVIMIFLLILVAKVKRKAEKEMK